MVDAPLIGPALAPDLHVMTYNIRRRIPHANRRSPDLWTPRHRIMRRLLQAERPTVLGVQEALPDQVQFLDECLGAGYQWVGRGRNANGSGEHCAIFYDSRRLTLLDWTQKALSNTPDVPGSRSFGNHVPRIAVLARFTDRVTGVEFLVVNTHFDHLSPKSRLRSAEMLSELVSSAAVPAVVMGDVNTRPGSRPYQQFTGGGQFRDAWTAARIRLTPAYTTFSNYRQPRIGAKRIDWILVSGPVTVRSVGINPFRLRGRAASDHEPVQAVLRINPEIT
ncbi:endonuclease/exonuclease/phosphatase family protein [Glaciihabitans tibetensis]|nr:endonuclease/exonuclease/phosphatase family protein [Glaciihabitans tibetensis]